MGLRADLAEHLRTQVPDLVAVWDHPAEVTAVPAAVIHPAPGEYWVPWTLGGPGVVAWAIVVEVVVQRTNPAAALDALEALGAEVIGAVSSFGTPNGGLARFQSYSDVGPVTVGDQEALSAQVSVLIPYATGQT